MPQEKAKEFKASNGFGADSDLKSQSSLIGFETPSCCNLNRKNEGFNIFQSSSLVVSYFQTSSLGGSSPLRRQKHMVSRSSYGGLLPSIPPF